MAGGGGYFHGAGAGSSSGRGGADYFGSRDFIWPSLMALAMAAGKLAVLWVLVLVVGGKVVPGILKKIVQTRSQELFVLTILVIAFITAVGAAYIFDASFASGRSSAAWSWERAMSVIRQGSS